MKNKVLIITPHYLPGYKAGGPIRSLSALVDTLGKELEFFVITSDRDSGESVPYFGVALEQYVTLGNAKILYQHYKKVTFRNLISKVNEIQPDIIYFSSAFSFHFTLKTIFLKKLGFLRDIKIIISPRGEFSPGALSLKSRKKAFFLFLSKLFCLYHHILWHATSLLEQKEIQYLFGTKSKIHLG